jgi:hypothetical protein
MRLSIHMSPFTKAATLGVAILCGVTAGWAQSAQSDPAPPPSQATGQPNKLFINLIDGEGALNDIRTRTAREPIVEVQDENHKPVAGALVLFTLDNGGGGSPFASFAGAQSLSVTTDAAGRAVGQGFAITRRKGQYKINVHASKGPATADTVITMENVMSAGSGSSGSMPTAIVSHQKLEWILGGVAVAGTAIAIAVVETRGSSPITATTGTGTVGPPSARPGFRISFHFK